MVGDPPQGSNRHPAAKSVKIQSVESDSQRANDSRTSSDHGISSRRMSSDSAHTGLKRASTGSERTPAVSDRSSKSDPIPPTTTTDRGLTPFTGIRQKAYHFDDEFISQPSSTCAGQSTGHAEMERASHNLVSHGPPMRRHTVTSHQPPVATPVVQSVNTLTTPCFAPPPSAPAVVRGVVVGIQDDSTLGSAPALVVGSASTRASSLTHVVPSGIYPQSGLSPFYPDFLRKRNTPDRHDVVAEEGDKELKLASHDQGFGGA